MAVHIRCDCGKDFAIPDERAAKPFKCYVCQRQLIFTLEEPSSNRPASEVEGKSVDLETPVVFPETQLMAGVPSEELERQLIVQGVGSETAKQLVEEHRAALIKSKRAAAQQKMISGVLFCVGGIGFSLLISSLLTSLGGSVYIIATGAIVGGIIQFARGLSQLPRDEEV